MGEAGGEEWGIADLRLCFMGVCRRKRSGGCGERGGGGIELGELG